MTKVLVTGATGAVGGHVIKCLLAANKNIVALSHNRQLEMSHPQLQSYQLDLWDQRAVTEFIRHHKADQLIHLAWEATPGQFWHSSHNFNWVAASSHLLREFVDAGGKRAVLAGTCAEYKWELTPLDETVSPLNPTTIYSASKVAFHTLAKAICQDISLAWGRVFFPYSPDEDKKRLVRYIADRVKAGQAPKIGVPDRAIDLIHIEDVALIFAKLADSSVEGPVNICSGQATLPYEVCRLFAELCGNKDMVAQFNDLTKVTTPTTSVLGRIDKLQTVLPISDFKTLKKGFETFL